jgi:hypothetical protein
VWAQLPGDNDSASWRSRSLVVARSAASGLEHVIAPSSDALAYIGLDRLVSDLCDSLTRSKHSGLVCCLTRGTASATEVATRRCRLRWCGAGR